MARVIELARVRVALRRILVIVERHARRDDVDQREAAVAHAGLDQRHELVLVAREAARDERAAERERDLHGIDRRLLVDLAALRFRADVGRRRELPLREAVHAVVLDDVHHVEIAAQRMHELPEADRQRIAVARDAEEMQLAVRGAGARRDRRHAAVHGVEPVRRAQEIRRRLRRAADAAHLRDAVRRNVELEERLHDRRRDRVVPAAGAERRHAAFVVAHREPERVALEPLVHDLRFRRSTSCGDSLRRVLLQSASATQR